METRDYSKFKFLKTNRAIKETNVAKIVSSIKEWGIIPGRPVLVDGDYNIIDGQHRFLAIKQLGHPVPYEVINGDVISKTMALNANQEQWKAIDYITSYSEQGIDCYRRLLKFIEKYKFSTNQSIDIFAQADLKMPALRKGIPFEVREDAESIAEYIINLKGVEFSKTRPFIRALITLHKKANPAQLNVLKTNILRVPKGVSVSDYINVFENIVNHKKRGNNILKL